MCVLTAQHTARMLLSWKYDGTSNHNNHFVLAFGQATSWSFSFSYPVRKPPLALKARTSPEQMPPELLLWGLSEESCSHSPNWDCYLWFFTLEMAL